MKITRIQSLIACWLALLALSSSAAQPVAVQRPLKTVSLQLIWKHQFQFAGYYMARHKGFYRDAGLDVVIHEYQGDMNPVTDVLQERRDFAVGRSTILADNASGAKIVALLAAFQNSPLMLLSTADSGISHPKHLRGKNIMMTSDAEHQVEVLAMLLQSGISEEDFVRQPHSFRIDSLIDGSTDAMASYLSNEPFQMQQQGEAYHVLHPQDYGFSMYSDILFTSQAYLSRHPDTVADFRRASIKGWLYAFSHIDETIDVILQHYNTQQRSPAALRFEGETLKSLAFDSEGRFGQLAEDKFNAMAQLFLLFNLIDKDYNLDNFIYRDRSAPQVPLSYDEIAFIETLRPLKVCGVPPWEPFSQRSNNQDEGIIPDYFALIQARIGLPTETVLTSRRGEALALIKDRHCDLIAGAMQTPQRAHELEFTRPYLSMPAVLAVSAGTTLNQPLESLLQHPIAILKDSAFEEIIRSRYPDPQLVPVASVEEGLNKVQRGEVFAMLDAADSIGMAINRLQLSNIKLVDQVNDSWDISIAIHRDWSGTPLPAILNKTIMGISPLERDQIRNRWAHVTYDYNLNYQRMWQGLSVVVLASLFFAYRYRVMQRHNQTLAAIAHHDNLTGLYNRCMLADSLKDAIAVSDRYARPLALIFFDIDDFKAINDRYGHNAGDTVLKEVAQILHHNCRVSDIAGRWGGEEFLIILPESASDSAQLSAEKLRKAIAGHRFSFSPDSQLTCSFGIAEYHHPESSERFVHRADQALYAAKDAGKNCCRVANGASENRPLGPR